MRSATTSFKGLRLAAKILHLVGVPARRRVAGEPPFTGLKELLRPIVVHRRGDALAAWFSDALSSPRSPSELMRIFSSAEKCRRVTRRMSLIASSRRLLFGQDFCLIFALLAAMMIEILLKTSRRLKGADVGQASSVAHFDNDSTATIGRKEGKQMQSWLDRRRARIERTDTEAEALIRDFGDEA